MKVLDDGNTLIFRFSPFSSLIIDRKTRELRYHKISVGFDEVMGFWKNYRFVGRKKVFYVVILTKRFMRPITPEMDEYDVDEVITSLREILGDDRYGR